MHVLYRKQVIIYCIRLTGGGGGGEGDVRITICTLADFLNN